MLKFYINRNEEFTDPQGRKCIGASVGMDGSLLDIITDACAAMHAIYAGLKENEDKEAAEAFKYTFTEAVKGGAVWASSDEEWAEAFAKAAKNHSPIQGAFNEAFKAIRNAMHGEEQVVNHDAAKDVKDVKEEETPKKKSDLHDAIADLIRALEDM